MALATDLSKLYIPLNFASDKSLKVAIFNLLVASSDQFFLVMRITIIILVEGMVYMFRAKIFNKKQEV